MESMISYTQAAVERAMKVQEVILRAMPNHSFYLGSQISLLPIHKPISACRVANFRQWREVVRQSEVDMRLGNNEGQGHKMHVKSEQFYSIP
jgi:hypothetical protein